MGQEGDWACLFRQERGHWETCQRHHDVRWAASQEGKEGHNDDRQLGVDGSGRDGFGGMIRRSKEWRLRIDRGKTGDFEKGDD